MNSSHPEYFKYLDKSEKIKNTEYDYSLKLIYQWVKAGDISFSVFKALVEDNHSTIICKG